METLNKHQLRTEATKRKLLKSARRVFARDGFEASRIDDIASDAGFTRGAFYAHFETKEELFLALLEDEAARRVKELRELLLNETGDAARLEAIRRFYAEQVSNESWCILLLEFKLYALRRVKQRKRLAKAHRRVRDNVTFQALQGLIPQAMHKDPSHKDRARLAFEALLCGLVLQRAYDPESLTVKEAKDLLGAYFDALVPATCGKAAARASR
jgi:AcrR family transcriptional regulator